MSEPIQEAQEQHTEAKPRQKHKSSHSKKRAALRKLFKRGAVAGSWDAPRFGA